MKYILKAAASFMALLASSSIFAQNPVTINCESGNRSTDVALCWVFPGTSYSSTAAISGTFSARTGQLTGTPNGAISPWVKFNGSGVITWQMKLDGWSATSRNFVLLKESPSAPGVFDTIYRYTFSSGTATVVQNPSVNVTFTGVYKLYFYMYGIGGTTRGILDNISIGGDYFASPSLGCIPTPTIADADGDGVADADDAYPADAERAYTTEFPSTGKQGTIMFEDNFPGMGDYDLNDLVADYKIKGVSNAANELVDLYFEITARACGGDYRNGFMLQFNDVAPDQIDSVTGSFTSGASWVNMAANGTERSQTYANILFFDDAYALLTKPSGNFINTILANPYATPVTVKVKVSFTRTAGRRINFPYLSMNPYMVVGQDRGIEVHLPDNEPTSLANTALFGTRDDNTDRAKGTFYRTKKGLPYAIAVDAESIPYMQEMEDIVKGYPRMVDWAQSNGATDNDWYIDAKRDKSKLYIR